MLGRTRGRSGAGRWRRCGVVGATALVALTISAAAHAASRDQVAPLYEARSAGIAHQYVVVLKGALPDKPTARSERRARAADARVASSVKAAPSFVYDTALKGFTADLTQAQVRRLRHSAQVKYVEQDARVHQANVQASAPWGLDRIDQRALPLSTTYDYPAGAGVGVHVYILDTGLQAQHPDYIGRAHNGFDAFGEKGDDCHGHGTHVAGIAAGSTYGVAKKAKLVGIRVLNCGGSGAFSHVIAGVNWVAEHHVAGMSVANMSLGGGANTALDDAVHKLVESGVFVSVAAGNSNTNACNTSPARVHAVFTTAASDSADAKASFSNYGPCVDGYAPGVHITSDWTGSTTKTISGTSMAAPAVAGAAALYLSQHHGSTPAHITTWLTDHATPGVIRNNLLETANRLLYMGGL
jgi:subtilisin family serine protease